MSEENRIDRARHDPSTLERMYREAVSAGEVDAFTEAIRESIERYPDDTLLVAWAYRLDISPPAEEGSAAPVTHRRGGGRWTIALVLGLLLGGAFVLLAGGGPPIPVPGISPSRFWVLWSPLTALVLLLYIAAPSGAGSRRRTAGPAAVFIVAVAVIAAMTGWNRNDDIATLIALHLPLLVWAAVGVGVVWGEVNPLRHGYAFLVKSAEAVLAAGVFLVVGMVFAGLTVGIFSVLDVFLSETFLNRVASIGIGAIAVLAVAAVYDPSRSPVEQEWHIGLSRLLAILSRLLLPVSLAVLLVYVAYFIPSNFFRAFEEREVLFVYNAVVLAMIVLIVVLSPERRAGTERASLVLRSGIVSAVVLTWLLNLYAFAANLNRTIDFGLTPNRHAVLGWNIATLILLAVVLWALIRPGRADWVTRYQNTIAWTTAIPILWALWVVVVLPHV